MRSFFPMRRAERLALFGLVAFSALSFLPPIARVSFFGVSLFGWLMAALLAGSPLLLLGLLRPATDRGNTDEPDTDRAPPGDERRPPPAS